jgi:hypothetical protein
MRHREYLKNHCGQIIQCPNCNKKWDTNQVVNCVVNKIFEHIKNDYPTYWPENLTFPLRYEQTELLALRYQYDMLEFSNEDMEMKMLYKLMSLLFFNTHDWKHCKGCFKKSNECRFNIPHKPSDKLAIEYSENCEEKLFSDHPSSLVSKWYHHDGSYHNVCSYEVLPKRECWDVFVNTNNIIVSELFGYNNNICM